MLLAEREDVILTLVNQRGVVSVRELADACAVTEVTIRRDLSKLEARRLLRRTHGGALRVPRTPAEPLEIPCDYVSSEPAGEIPDALILAPVQHSAVHTMRERALRNHIPLLAESAHLPGAVYLGPNNYEAAFHLGQWTGRALQERRRRTAAVLDISQGQLANTRTRSVGFAEGLRYVLGDAVVVTTVDGRGLFNSAYQVALDTLAFHPEIDVIFGINDDSILGGLQAYLDLSRDTDALIAVNVGGEGTTLFDRLAEGGPLKACLALFPEVVGRLGIEGVSHLWAGHEIGREIITPSALITADTLRSYYTRSPLGWTLNPGATESLDQTRWACSVPRFEGKRVAFVIHYCTHEWYQNLARAMHERAAILGITLSVEDVKEDLKAETRELRRLIGKLAATYVEDGDTIILDSGTPTTFMAQFLQHHRDLTVITNSPAVFQVLQPVRHINVMLTGGEFHRESEALVGRGGILLLREIRASKAFIVADGVTQAFGVSAQTVAEAEMRRAMIKAAREVIVLADHTVLGQDAHARVTDLNEVHTLITDAGAHTEHRLELHQAGIKLLIAGQILNGAAREGLE